MVNSLTGPQRNIELLYNTEIPLPGIDSRELKAYVHTKTCTQIFIGALFIIDKK